MCEGPQRSGVYILSVPNSPILEHSEGALCVAKELEPFSAVAGAAALQCVKPSIHTLQHTAVRGCSGYPRTRTLQHTAVRIGSGCAHTYTLQDTPVRGCSGYPRAHTLQHTAVQRQPAGVHTLTRCSTIPCLDAAGIHARSHAAAHCSGAWRQRVCTRSHDAAHTLQCVEAAGMHALTRCNTQCVEAAGMHTLMRCRMRGATEVQGGAGVDYSWAERHVGRVFVSWERLARGSPEPRASAHATRRIPALEISP